MLFTTFLVDIFLLVCVLVGFFTLLHFLLKFVTYLLKSPPKWPKNNDKQYSELNINENTLSSFAIVRLNREMECLLNNSSDLKHCKLSTTICNTSIITFKGYKNTPYENGMYKLYFNISYNYPFTPPNIYLNTKIYHPSILNGEICNELLYKHWSPVVTIESLIISIITLIHNPWNCKYNPLNREAFDLLRNGKIKEFNIKASQWNVMYANGPKEVYFKYLKC